MGQGGKRIGDDDKVPSLHSLPVFTPAQQPKAELNKVANLRNKPKFEIIVNHPLPIPKLNAMKTLLINISLLLFVLPSKAQYVLKEAHVQYEFYNYSKAIDLYEQAYIKKPSLYAAERLASCYELVHNYKETESWAAIAAGMTGSKPENVLAYAKALQHNSKYSEARIQYEKYAAMNKNTPAAQKSAWLLSCDSAMHWMKSPKSVIIDNHKALNTPQSDWGAVQIAGATVFTSDRSVQPHSSLQTSKKSFLKFDGSKKPNPTIYGWTGHHYLRLFSQTGTSNNIEQFPVKAETNYHIGSATFNGAGNEMYFTLTRIPEKPKYVNGRLATINVEIYSCQKDANGTWSAPLPFAYNNVNEYSVGDPYLSKDGKVLYFSATFLGGQGGTDLYYCMRTESGQWGKPINLEQFNTKGNERTPFFDSNNAFYFSSDGLIGMGGLDIFKSVEHNGKMSRPVNMGYPINSPQDDFAFNLSKDSEGYLSSNRIEGMGDDDIYSFKIKEPAFIRLTGVAYNKQTKAPLGNAIITIAKTNGGQLKTQTDADGQYQLQLDTAADYHLTGDKTGFRSEMVNINTRNLALSATLKQSIELEPIVINKAIKIDNIYYDFNQSAIRKDAAIELNKLVRLMRDNPTLWIELGSHTDSRGNDQYNLQLSQKRADAVVKYIVDSGINPNRIVAKGYGESQPVNRCTKGISCSNAAHQANRRTEFKIIKY